LLTSLIESFHAPNQLALDMEKLLLRPEKQFPEKLRFAKNFGET